MDKTDFRSFIIERRVPFAWLRQTEGKSLSLRLYSFFLIFAKSLSSDVFCTPEASYIPQICDTYTLGHELLLPLKLKSPVQNTCTKSDCRKFVEK